MPGSGKPLPEANQKMGEELDLRAEVDRRHNLQLGFFLAVKEVMVGV